jgi:hypothetical protein
MRSTRYTILIAVLLLGAAQTAVAQVPASVNAGKVTYVTGGIGESEVTAMRAQAREYSALIEFVEIEPGNPRGVWTADVAVSIKSGKEVLATFDATGPLLLLRLPAGRYTVEATHGGVAMSKPLAVAAGANPAQERFIWRAQGSLGGEARTQPQK